MTLPKLTTAKLAAVLVLLSGLAILLAEAFGHTSISISGVPGDIGVYLLVLGFALFTGQPITPASEGHVSAIEAKAVEMIESLKPLFESMVQQSTTTKPAATGPSVKAAKVTPITAANPTDAPTDTPKV